MAMDKTHMRYALFSLCHSHLQSAAGAALRINQASVRSSGNLSPLYLACDPPSMSVLTETLIGFTQFALCRPPSGVNSCISKANVLPTST